MIKEIINSFAIDGMKYVFKSIKSMFHVNNGFQTYNSDAGLIDEAVRMYVGRLMKGKYPNGYSLNKLDEDNVNYGVIGKYAVILYDGIYTFFLDPLNILIITIKTENIIQNTSFEWDYFITVDFDFYGTKAAYYERKIVNTITKLRDLYFDRKKNKTNLMTYKYLSSTSNKNHNITRVFWNQIIFDEKEYLIRMIDGFLKSKDMYNKLGIQYRLGILLYGSPGTGKSTIARAVSEYTDKLLIIVKGKGIANIHEYRNSVILIEEIDRDLVRYVKDGDNYKKVIDQEVLKLYLTEIDLVGNGSIIIATTNHIENLDDALIRDGRFDIRICMHDFRRDQAEEMCKLYGVDPTLLPESEGKDQFYNPAELQNVLKESLITKEYINNLKNKELSDDEFKKEVEKVLRERSNEKDKAIMTKMAINKMTEE